MAEALPFDLRVTLISGRSLTFGQEDEAKARQNIARLRSQQIFRESALVISSRGRVTVIQTGQIIRVDVMGEAGDWTHSVAEIEGDELERLDFTEQVAGLEDSLDETRRVRAGEAIVLYLELEDVRGATTYLRVATEAANEVVRARLLRQIFDLDRIVTRRPGSFGLLNPRQLAAAHLIPAPREVSYKDLEADRF